MKGLPIPPTDPQYRELVAKGKLDVARGAHNHDHNHDGSDGSGVLDGAVINNYLDLVEQGSAPGTPPSGKVRVYAKTDDKVYKKTDAGAESELGAGGGGAKRQWKFRLDDLGLSSGDTDTKAWDVWRGSNCTVKAMADCEAAVGLQAQFKVFKDGVAVETLTVSAGGTSSGLGSVSISLVDGSKIGITRSVGNDNTGKRVIVTLIEQ